MTADARSRLKNQPPARGRHCRALLACDTLEEAATAAGVHITTLYRWLKHEPFQAAHREARRQVVQQAITHMQRVCRKAVTTLVAVMEDDEASAAAKVAAARAVLELSLKAVEVEDLEQRLIALENRASHHANGQRV